MAPLPSQDLPTQMGVKWSNRDGKHLHFELVNSGRIVMGFSSLDNPWLVQCWEILSHKINRDISRVISYESVRASTICPYLPWVLMGFGRQRRTLFHQVQRYPADPPAFPFGNELGSECQAAKGRYHGRGHKKYGGFHKSRYPKMDRNSWRSFFFGALFPYNILVIENFWDSTMTPLTGNSGMPRTPVGWRLYWLI